MMEKKAISAIVLLASLFFLIYGLGNPVNAAAGFNQSGYSTSATEPSIVVPAPEEITIVAGYKGIELTWKAVPEVARYNIYRSTTQGSGYILVGEVAQNFSSTHYQFIDLNLTNQVTYYYVVTAISPSGQESDYSNEVDAMPHLPFEWVGTIIPKDVEHTMGMTTPVSICGEFFMYDYEGNTNPLPPLTGRKAPESDLEKQNPPFNGFIPVEGITAQLGYGPANLSPSQWTNWVDASFWGGWYTYAPDSSPHDRYCAEFIPQLYQAQTINGKAELEYVFRFSSSNGKYWTYGGLYWNIDPSKTLDSDENTRDERGLLTVYTSPTEPVPVLPKPINLKVAGVTKTTINLEWDEPILTEEEAKHLYKYQIRRSENGGEPYTVVGSVLPTISQPQKFQDTGLVAGRTYYYSVCALNFNLYCSEYSDQKAGTTEKKDVSITVEVTVPTFTPLENGIYLSKITGTSGAVEWKAKPLTRVGTSQVFGTTFTLREGERYNFRVSRGSEGTIQTLADGNSPAYDPSFTAKSDANGKQLVQITVANWDDPLIRTHSPAHQAVVKGTATVQVVWNQSMPASTTFKVVDTHANNANVSGKFSLDMTGQVLTFTPMQSMIGNHIYQVTVSQQPDKQSPKPVTQTTQKTWSFKVQPYQMYLPITRR